jgi:DNA-directed RNA polymerase specialized sigma24 family protein
MDTFTKQDESARQQPAAVLHVEVARPPEAMRRAVILCEVEGMTQVEAARVTSSPYQPPPTGVFLDR